MITANRRQSHDLPELIKVQPHESGGPYFIDLMNDGALAFSLGPYQNPGVAVRQARDLREYMARLLVAPPENQEMSEHGAVRRSA